MNRFAVDLGADGPNPLERRPTVRGTARPEIYLPLPLDRPPSTRCSMVASPTCATTMSPRSILSTSTGSMVIWLPLESRAHRASEHTAASGHAEPHLPHREGEQHGPGSGRRSLDCTLDGLAPAGPRRTASLASRSNVARPPAPIRVASSGRRAERRSLRRVRRGRSTRQRSRSVDQQLGAATVSAVISGVLTASAWKALCGITRSAFPLAPNTPRAQPARAYSSGSRSSRPRERVRRSKARSTGVVTWRPPTM